EPREQRARPAAPPRAGLREAGVAAGVRAGGAGGGRRRRAGRDRNQIRRLPAAPARRDRAPAAQRGHGDSRPLRLRRGARPVGRGAAEARARASADHWPGAAHPGHDPGGGFAAAGAPGARAAQPRGVGAGSVPGTLAPCPALGQAGRMSEPSSPQAVVPRGHSELAVLRISIMATTVVAVRGIVFGVMSGSFAIVFDGVFSLFDGMASLVALLVANMIATYGAAGARSRKLAERFTMGVWHLEPMVLGASGLLLIGAACYALINAIDSFLTGGRPLQFGQAITYAVVTLAISIGAALYGHRANRRLRSALVAIDVQGWAMSAAITAALLVAFVAGLFLQGT